MAYSRVLNKKYRVPYQDMYAAMAPYMMQAKQVRDADERYDEQLALQEEGLDLTRDAQDMANARAVEDMALRREIANEQAGQAKIANMIGGAQVLGTGAYLANKTGLLDSSKKLAGQIGGKISNAFSGTTPVQTVPDVPGPTGGIGGAGYIPSNLPSSLPRTSSLSGIPVNAGSSGTGVSIGGNPPSKQAMDVYQSGGGAGGGAVTPVNTGSGIGGGTTQSSTPTTGAGTLGKVGTAAKWAGGLYGIGKGTYDMFTGDSMREKGQGFLTGMGGVGLLAGGPAMAVPAIAAGIHQALDSQSEPHTIFHEAETDLVWDPEKGYVLPEGWDTSMSLGRFDTGTMKPGADKGEFYSVLDKYRSGEASAGDVSEYANPITADYGGKDSAEYQIYDSMLSGINKAASDYSKQYIDAINALPEGQREKAHMIMQANPLKFKIPGSSPETRNIDKWMEGIYGNFSGQGDAHSKLINEQMQGMGSIGTDTLAGVIDDLNIQAGGPQWDPTWKKWESKSSDYAYRMDPVGGMLGAG